MGAAARADSRPVGHVRAFPAHAGNPGLDPHEAGLVIGPEVSGDKEFARREPASVAVA